MIQDIGLSIVLSIAGLAALDSINPVELLAGIFLFTIKKPLSRFFSYTIGIFVFHLILGFILYYAFHFILDLKIFDSPVFDRSIELIGGILLIYLGFTMKNQNRGTAKAILNPTPLQTFLLGIVITASAIPTSAAYYSALGIIANNKLPFGELSFLLIMYNIIFVLPLFILLGIYLIFKNRSEKIFEHVRNFIVRKLNKLMRIILILVGLLLIANFIEYLFQKSVL